MTLRGMQVGDRLEPAQLIGERWFAAPAAPIRSIAVAERFDFGSGGALAILRVELDDGVVLRSMPIEGADGRGPWAALLELATRGGSVSGVAASKLVGLRAHGRRSSRGRSVRPLGNDQSHTSVVIDDAVVLKLYRALTIGVNPEVELGLALALDRVAPVPGYWGAVLLELAGSPGSSGAPGAADRAAIAFAQAFVPDAGDAFEELAERLAAWLRAGAPERELPNLTSDGARAGRATARLHGSLALVRGPGFEPRPAGPEDVDRWVDRATDAHRRALDLLGSADPHRARWLADHDVAIARALAPLAGPAAAGGVRLQRIHADLHLGQLLRAGDDFLIGDLEGDPTRPADERRELDTPLRDIASMRRSFDHVARSGMRRSGVPIDAIIEGSSSAESAIDAWLAAIGGEFLRAYRAAAGRVGLQVDVDEGFLRALEIEKELREFEYAATYLPAWMYAPAAGMRWLLDHPGGGI